MKAKLIIIIGVLSLTITCGRIIAQNKTGTNMPFGLNIGQSISGSGTGSYYNFSLNKSFGRSTLLIFGNIQKVKKHFSGYGVTYTFSPNPMMLEKNQKCELFFFGTVLYNYSSFLNKTHVELERSVGWVNDEVNISEVSFKILEQYIGFGLKRKLFSNLNIFSSIGIGSYHTIKSNFLLYRDNADCSLQLQWGLNYNISK